MPMKERRGRNRVSKADQIAGKIAQDPIPSGRNRVSKADRVAEKITGNSTPSGRSRVSKADRVAEKITGNSVPTGRSRVSKADEVVRKIESTTNPVPPTSTRVRPSSKVDEINKKIPSRPASAPSNTPFVPQQPSSRVPNPPAARKKSGCCLLPFTLIAACIIGVLTVVL